MAREKKKNRDARRSAPGIPHVPRIGETRHAKKRAIRGDFASNVPRSSRTRSKSPLARYPCDNGHLMALRCPAPG